MALPTPKPDSAVSRGIRTFVQAFIGFAVGLIVVVWTVPGVPIAVLQYVSDNWLSLAVELGVPTGLASFIWNVLRKDIPNL